MSIVKLNAEGYPESVIQYCQSGMESVYEDDGYIDIPEPPGWDHKWDGVQWIHSPKNNFETDRRDKSAAISQSCRSAILSGFDSSALGCLHHYPSQLTDQQNLASSVLASLLPGLPDEWTTPFWCSDTSGVWAFRLHTAAQIQQVGQDAKAAILAAMGKNEVLQAQIVAATSIESLDAIEW